MIIDAVDFTGAGRPAVIKDELGQAGGEFGIKDFERLV